jgi:septal ring factor EnvC (AmiA/AmiB activator)
MTHGVKLQHHRIWFVLALAALSCLSLSAFTDAFAAGTPASSHQVDLRKKKSDLEKLRKDINRYEEKIKEKEKKEHATLDLLDTYDRQTALLHKLIKKLRDDEQSLQQDIEQTKQSINELSGQVSFLKKQYAQYVTTAYTHGQTYDLELLLASKSLNQLLIRTEYLKRFSDQRRNDLARMTTHRIEYENQNARLQDQLSEQRDLIRDKANEEAKLVLKAKKRKLVLADIRKDKKSFRQEINRKTEAAKDLEVLIVNLIEQERIKKEREARTNPVKPPEREAAAGGGPFEAKRGRLRWPVSQGKVVARFGSQQNAVLHTVTQNNGIDIAVPAGTSVGAIAGGEVSTIWWLPSFGNLVIINHSNGYRTVYAHLSEISVNEGERIADGASLGKSGEALSGPMLHFEIWKGRDKQDPEQWLLPRGLTQR